MKVVHGKLTKDTESVKIKATPYGLNLMSATLGALQYLNKDGLPSKISTFIFKNQKKISAVRQRLHITELEIDKKYVKMNDNGDFLFVYKYTEQSEGDEHPTEKELLAIRRDNQFVDQFTLEPVQNQHMYRPFVDDDQRQNWADEKAAFQDSEHEVQIEKLPLAVIESANIKIPSSPTSGPGSPTLMDVFYSEFVSGFDSQEANEDELSTEKE